MQQNKPTVKISELNAKLNQLTCAILAQRQEIESLELLKNQAILCVKNYQKDIELLQNVINLMKSRIHPQQDPQKKLFLGEFDVMINRFNSKLVFKLVGMNKMNVNELVCSVRYSNNGYFIVFATYANVFLYDAIKQVPIHSAIIPFESKEVKEKVTRNVLISPNSCLIAVVAADFSIVLFKIPTLKLFGRIRGSSKSAPFMCFFNDSQHIVTTGFKGEIDIWYLPQLVKERAIPFDDKMNIVGINLSKDNDTMIVTCSGGLSYIFNDILPNQKPHICQASVDFILNTSISLASNYFAVCNRNNDVNLFSLSDGFQFIKTLRGHSDSVVCAEFDNKGKLLLTGSKDESIKVWSVESGEMIWTVPLNENTVFCISHHPFKNEFIACTGDGSINVISYSMANQK